MSCFASWLRFPMNFMAAWIDLEVVEGQGAHVEVWDLGVALEVLCHHANFVSRDYNAFKENVICMS